MNASHRPLRYISLLAGGGGLHLGFKQAGFEPIFALDIEATAAATFEANAPGVSFHRGDIRHMTPRLLAELSKGRTPDVIVGGPPCQGFSTLGDQIQGDPRNSLFEAFARVIRWAQPVCVVMENTSYVRSQYGGRYEQEIRQTLTSLGYQVSVNTLNAADYGTPQVRRRAFFIATRLNHDFAWPKATHGEQRANGLEPYLTVGQALMDIADLAKTGSMPNHSALRHSETVIARYKLIPEGGRLPPPQFLPKAIRRRNFGNTYKRLHRDRPSLTLVPGNNAFPIHPTENRSLTPREAARLQGFPDDYVFAGSRAEQCKLVGNAVPVPLARAVAMAVKDHIEGAHARKALEVRQASDAPRAGQLLMPLVEVSDHGKHGPALRVREGNRGGRRLTAASFFTGAGGLLLGFQRAGFQVQVSYDRKAHIARNLGLNFPDLNHRQADVGLLTVNDVKSDVNGTHIDVVFGGPPCQGFSIFGNRRFVNTRGHKPETDDRNELSLHYIALAVRLQPRVIFLENVKGLVSTARGSGSYLQEIVRRLKRGGYHVEFRVINSADYGVPQLRERLILVASEAGLGFEWPQPKFHPAPKPWQRGYMTVGDVLADLADPTTYDPAFSHVPMNHKPMLVERYKLIPEGGKLSESDLPDALKRGYRTENVKNFSHVYRRLSRDKPAGTMVPGHNAFPIHPFLDRALTVREAARIQTFTDRFRFEGTRQQQCALVGNAVPPLVGEIFAQAIAKAIMGNASTPGYKADHYELTALR